MKLIWKNFKINFIDIWEYLFLHSTSKNEVFIGSLKNSSVDSYIKRNVMIW